MSGTPPTNPQIPPDAPPPLTKPPLGRQTLRRLTFVHWPVTPSTVLHLLPSGTEPDVYDGMTYVGLVSFRVTTFRLGGIVPIGGFNEANVRLYSRDRQGRQGVVFLSLNVDRPDVALAGRLLTGLPYRWCGLTEETTGTASGMRHRRRRTDPAAASAWRTRHGEVLPRPGPLDVFLTARWGLHVRRFGRTWWLPVWHEPLALHRDEIDVLDVPLLHAAGVHPDPGASASALSAPLSHFTLGRPIAV